MDHKETCLAASAALTPIYRYEYPKVKAAQGLGHKYYGFKLGSHYSGKLFLLTGPHCIL